MINRFALIFLCIELDRDKIFGVMLVYILLTLCFIGTNIRGFPIPHKLYLHSCGVSIQRFRSVHNYEECSLMTRMP